MSIGGNLNSNVFISKSSLKGVIKPPASKSQTIRALLFAFLAKGKSVISSPLLSPDTDAMIEAISLLGGNVERFSDHIEITGVDGKIGPAEDVLNAGNSGLVLRFMGAIGALGTHPIVITGDRSIRHNRATQPLLDGLNQLGASAISTKGDGFAPLIVQGRMKGGRATLSGEDSQPVSALLIAASFLENPVELFVQRPGEKPWIDLTLSWLKKFHLDVSHDNYTHYRVKGQGGLNGFSYTPPADFSSSAFPLIGALITQSEVEITGLAMDDLQGDKKVFDVVKAMGGKLQIKENSLVVGKSTSLKGIEIDVNEIIDAVPILATLACFAEGKTVLKNAKIARNKESDRLSCITKELRKMGAHIEEEEDSLTIYPASLKGAVVESHEDHRIAMSLAIAAMGASGTTELMNTHCIAKTYPHFFEEIEKLGGNVK